MSTDSLKNIRTKSSLRRKRTRSQLDGSANRPRLTVHISHRNVIAQIVNDESGETLVYVSSVAGKEDGKMSDKAARVGEEIAKQAVKVKIKKVVFDRGSSKYHGRVKKLAEAAREGGLEF